MTSRRRMVLAIAAVAVWSPLSFAQQKVYQIGYLANDPDQNGPTYRAFLGGLRNLGWIEGKNVRIHYLTSHGRDSRFPELAAEAVRRNVDVIMTSNSGSTRAAIAATERIPIVFGSAANPVEQKFVASLAHPGGNVTGLALLVRELGPKRLQLLKEILPRATRVARLYQGNVPTAPTGDDNAPALGITLIDAPAATVDDIEAAIVNAVRQKIDAMTVKSDGMLVINRDKIAAIALKYKLPLLGHDGRFADAGALASYGEDFAGRYRRAASLVDKILRGTRPADLPVEQSMEFEFAINLKTAREIGVAVPTQVLSLADRVIK